MSAPLFFVFVREWHPGPGWAGDYVRPAYCRCAARPSDPDAVPAWTNLCLMLGATRAAPLCLMVGLHARSLLPEPVRDMDVEAQIDLCLWSMNLTRAGQTGVPLRLMGNPIALRRDDAKLDAWLEHELAPFDHRLDHAALATLRLAALRTGVIHGPAEPTVEQLLDADAWRLEPVRQRRVIRRGRK
jgi:hypothetical protein